MLIKNCRNYERIFLKNNFEIFNFIKISINSVVIIISRVIVIVLFVVTMSK